MVESPNQDDNALKVLAETASHDELLNPHDDGDARRHGSRSSSGNTDHSSDYYYSTSSGGAKEDDDSGGRASDGSSSNRKAADKAIKVGLRKGQWIVSRDSIIYLHHVASPCCSCRYVISYLMHLCFIYFRRKRKKNTLQESFNTSVRAFTPYPTARHSEVSLQASCSVILCASQRSLQELLH